MPRALILRAADRYLDHPSPRVIRLHYVTALCLIDVALTGARLGRRLWR